MKSKRSILYKINEINKSINYLHNEILVCLEHQMDNGDRINEECDYIANRKSKIMRLQNDAEVLRWVLDEDTTE